MNGSVILTEGLTKHYGTTPALQGLDLDVRRGEVYGFLGPNGAGKTTTIRLLLDFIRPTAGRLRVLGVDPRAGGAAPRRRIGYLPGELPDLGRQRAGELLTYFGNLSGGVDPGRVHALADRLDLDLTRPIRSLSKGNRQKVGLVQAFMHEPELLVLDEPTSGLDPLLQQEFAALVREARAEGRTVFMSSHVLSEVEHLADRIAILRDGRLVTVEEVAALKQRAVRRVEVRFASAVPEAAFAGLTDVRDLQVAGDTVRCVVDGTADALVKAAARFTVISMTSAEPDLEEVFFAYYASKEDGPHAA
jgi:ABC-2 type transport system ATP-binding protein